MCWVAMNDLCDMGVSVDIGQIYDITLESAVECLNQASHPVSTRGKVDLKGDLKGIHLKGLQPPKSKTEGVGRGNKNGVMEKRKAVEHNRDLRISPRASSSLGKFPTSSFVMTPS
jgi:hypothetical protein